MSNEVVSVLGRVRQTRRRLSLMALNIPLLPRIIPSSPQFPLNQASTRYYLLTTELTCYYLFGKVESFKTN